MSRWLATEGNVEAQIKANKNKLEKCFDTVVLDNQDLTLRLSTATPAGSPAGRLWTQYCRGAEHAQRPEAALTSQMVSLKMRFVGIGLLALVCFLLQVVAIV